MTSLLGLYDLYVETSDPRVCELFQEGVEGLKHFLPRWDYRKKWSLYSNRGCLCSPAYDCLNRLLLSVLARLTGDPCLAGDATHGILIVFRLLIGRRYILHSS